MYLRFLKLVGLLLLAGSAFAQPKELRVCADPDNLPFSNTKRQGFENKIAEIIARDLHAQVTYYWQRMGRGYVRSVLNASKCDLVPGIPTSFSPVLTTSPYYKSTYVFVTRKDRRLNVQSFDDPQLRNLKIGVQVLEDDYAPPGRALGRRSLASNIVGYDTEADPDSIVRAVASGAVDVGVIWGPMAGYFAKRQRIPLSITPVTPEFDPPALPFTFEISMGVRKNDKQFHEKLERILFQHRVEIKRLLAAYGVPQLAFTSSVQTGAGR
ncbi:MAG: amino acid transporter substrate-binding protein [Acidobacteriales bacterium]|nr:amino acid transporter substrate-binding protein [Terriglobales bacterium]